MFITDAVLERGDICNLKKEAEVLGQHVQQGRNIVIYGQRNTGKTSLVKSIVIPEFLKKHSKSIAVFVDLLGIHSIEDIEVRLRVGVQEALAKSFPSQARFQTVASMLQSLRPQLSFDSMTGEVAFTIIPTETKKKSIETILSQLAEFHKTHPVLLVIDEFQDIVFAKGAEAFLRTLLQNLPGSLPVIILGSKKHLLSKIFAAPRAPFANWGIDLEMPMISSKDYHKYIAERFKRRQLEISLETTQYLQDQMRGIPESINLVCAHIYEDSHIKGEVSKEVVARAINKLVENRQSRFEEYLIYFTANEVSFLKNVSLEGPIKSITSKDFISKTSVTSAGTLRIARKLEDDAVIYNTSKGYILADPLLERYLVRFR